jgi:hypothetical protein
MVPFSQTVFQFGIVDQSRFSQPFAPGAPGADAEIMFPIQFPASVALNSIRVIVTPSDAGVGPDKTQHHAGVVGGAFNVQRDRFTITSYSPDCAAGFAGFNYVALAETPGVSNDPLPDIRIGVLQPLEQHPDVIRFASNCTPGDTRFWAQQLRKPFNDTVTPTVVLTVSDLNVHPFDFRQIDVEPECVPITGMVEVPQFNRFGVRARNFDSVGGLATFFYVALANPLPGVGGGAGTANMFVDSGHTGRLEFEPGGQHGDWNETPVGFTQPFIAPPVVLVTAHSEISGVGKTRPILAQARHVTPFGFTLSARNPNGDTSLGGGGGGGAATFDWIAFGCGPGCGGG